MKLGKYSFGTGDRFAKQGTAQLKATMQAQQSGIEISHVWNKSYREHKTVKSGPESVRREAEEAVKNLGFNGQYLVDADHINLKNVDDFIQWSDFFTIDVADYIGKKAPDENIREFVANNRELTGEIRIEGLSETFRLDENTLESIAGKFLFACQEAAAIYRHIAEKKGAGKLVAEVSMDEVDQPQSPLELLVILKMLSDLKVPVQTIAPKFTGRFNKGVDYVGDLEQFTREFEADILVIAHAIRHFNLPENLKLSVHSGSDKFSLYPIINRLIKKYNAGVHVKTAGTTWLEELIGLAESEGEALQLAKEIYFEALDRFDELTGPYATVIDVSLLRLPTRETVTGWSGQEYAAALKHDQKNPAFNPDFRQLLHCGYKVAAEKGAYYLEMLNKHQETVQRNVTENLLERHLKPIFL